MAPTTRSRPRRADGAHSDASSVRFAHAARSLGEAARGRGLVVPAFRSPPRLVDVDRTIRRRRDGGATVSVRLRGRPWPAVLGDMVEGVVVANGLTGADAMRVRTALWEAVDGEVGADAA
ncbi:hypothetical protein [Actinomarinicola tropica]|uniref:Uncharacterized protein n=1 Tax=Actinomarinicola tropica TaxID=2789776 RepID=A0A5Q2RLZ8_9ACTN|nr:hypothetical protein [Actinomarinicola tropica]QGG95962.1 hypothetical protein GH723_13115 [Actinomarinicola tropica]